MVKVAVIGAGVVGLAAASELTRAGADVRCFERAGVASAQSKGRTRIFRQAHGDPRLVELAMRARAGWRAWEERFGRRLVGDEGLVVTGAEVVPAWQRAMQSAGAPCRLLPADEGRDRLPVANLPPDSVLLDPAGGATRARRTVDLLRADVGSRLQLSEVLSLERRNGGCRVETAEGPWTCDEIVIAAGVDSCALAAQVGLDLPSQVSLHSRFTFEVRGDFSGKPLSCWIDDSGRFGPGWRSYGQPVGSTGLYAVGVSWEGQRCTPDVGAEEVSRQSREVAREYVRQALPGLHSEPVDEIQCTHNDYAFLDRGDGFTARREEGVTVLYGNNLFKFAPLLGQLLKETVMTGTLPEDLSSPASMAGAAEDYRTLPHRHQLRR